MLAFFAIFLGLIILNILLLVFSSSLKIRAKNKTSLSLSSPLKGKIYSLHRLDSKYQKAV